MLGHAVALPAAVFSQSVLPPAVFGLCPPGVIDLKLIVPWFPFTNRLFFCLVVHRHSLFIHAFADFLCLL